MGEGAGGRGTEDLMEGRCCTVWTGRGGGQRASEQRLGMSADPGHSKAEVVMAEVEADMGGGGPSWAAADRETRVRDGGAEGKPSWVKRSRGSMWAQITSSELTDVT